MKNAWKRLWEDIRAYYRGALLAAAYVTAAIALKIPVCPLVLMTGLPCPGCGMTRAMLLFLSGRWLEAWRMHPFFYVLLALAAAVAFFRYGLGRRVLWAQWAVFVILLLAIVFYVYRMARYFPGQTPMVYEPRNVLRLLERIKGCFQLAARFAK